MKDDTSYNTVTVNALVRTAHGLNETDSPTCFVFPVVRKMSRDRLRRDQDRFCQIPTDETPMTVGYLLQIREHRPVGLVLHFTLAENTYKKLKVTRIGHPDDLEKAEQAIDTMLSGLTTGGILSNKKEVFYTALILEAVIAECRPRYNSEGYDPSIAEDKHRETCLAALQHALDQDHDLSARFKRNLLECAKTHKITKTLKDYFPSLAVINNIQSLAHIVEIEAWWQQQLDEVIQHHRHFDEAMTLSTLKPITAILSQADDLAHANKILKTELKTLKKCIRLWEAALDKRKTRLNGSWPRWGWYQATSLCHTLYQATVIPVYRFTARYIGETLGFFLPSLAPAVEATAEILALSYAAEAMQATSLYSHAKMASLFMLASQLKDTHTLQDLRYPESASPLTSSTNTLRVLLLITAGVESWSTGSLISLFLTAGGISASLLSTWLADKKLSGLMQSADRSTIALQTYRAGSVLSLILLDRIGTRAQQILANYHVGTPVPNPGRRALLQWFNESAYTVRDCHLAMGAQGLHYQCSPSSTLFTGGN